MFNEDPARTHVSAGRDMIVALYESTNQPLVQVPGKSAQAAQAAIVASRLGRGFEIVIALTFLESGDNVLYTPQQFVDDAGLPEKIEEALNFAESMGFILDSAGWAALDGERRDELRVRLPAFRAPTQQRAVSKPAAPREQDSLAAVARLFAAFAMLLAALQVGAAGQGHPAHPGRAGARSPLLPWMAAARDHPGGAGQSRDGRRGVPEVRRHLPGHGRRAPAARQALRAPGQGAGCARRVREMRQDHRCPRRQGPRRMSAAPQGAGSVLRALARRAPVA